MGDGRRRDPARGTEMGFDTYWNSADLPPKQKDLEDLMLGTLWGLVRRTGSRNT